MVGKARNDMLTHTLIDFLMGETDGVPKDPNYIYRLYMALGSYSQAAKTAIIIAKQEQDLGNYKVGLLIFLYFHYLAARRRSTGSKPRGRRERGYVAGGEPHPKLQQQLVSSPAIPFSVSSRKMGIAMNQNEIRCRKNCAFIIGGARNLVRDDPSAGGPGDPRAAVPSPELRTAAQLHPGG